MKKLLSHALSKLDASHSSSPSLKTTPPHSSTITPPTPLSLHRYRHHHGTNLGSIFVLERWLHPSMFSSPDGSSELDAITHNLQTAGVPATKSKWESHWRDALSDADLAWLVHEARCTSIRLPIGYFTLGAAFCAGTPFESVAATGVYEGAWEAVRELVRRCEVWGVGVLVDVHALPGGANGDAHSGTAGGKAGLWGSRKDLELAKRVVVEVVRRCKGVGNLTGVQVVNEAVWGAEGLWDWYADVLGGIAEVDSEVPVYISDAWDLGKALEWVRRRRGGNPIVVDTHRYFTFSEKDRAQSPQQIIDRVPGELAEVRTVAGSVVDRGAAQVVVGEWSCVLDGATWARVGDGEKEGLVRRFGEVQCETWRGIGVGGSFFWTLKMDWMDGGEWGFVEQTKKGNVVSPGFLRLPAADVRETARVASGKREALGGAAKAAHEEYWNRTSPGTKFEHYLYGEGWDVGFSDAHMFFTMRVEGALGDKCSGTGGDKIGCLEIWVEKRLEESGRRGEFVWEWEQGLRAGIKAFEDSVGI